MRKQKYAFYIKFHQERMQDSVAINNIIKRESTRMFLKIYKTGLGIAAKKFKKKLNKYLST